MKKLFVILMAVVLCFAFAACGEGESAESDQNADQVYTAIPLGGELGEFTLDGDEYGEYVLNEEIPDDFTFENTETAFYVDETAAVPYICVYRWENTNGYSLEDAANEEAESCRTSVRNMTENAAFLYGGGYLSDMSCDYCYFKAQLMADGDDFVELVFYYPTEEIAFGDSGLSLYIPANYTDATEQQSNADFYALYDYAGINSFWMGIREDSFEGNSVAWETAKGYAVTEELWNKCNDAGWNDEALSEFFAASNGTMLVADTREIEGHMFNYQIARNNWWFDEECDTCFINTDIDGFLYEITMTSDGQDNPTYLYALLDSIHQN